MNSRVARGLGLAGLVPFLGLAILVAADYQGWAAPASDALRIYAALILSFLGGTTWGVALRQNRTGLFWLSMVPFFAAWAALLVSGRPSFGILLAAFATAHGIDHIAHRRRLLPDWFMGLRRLLTLVVMVCLVIALLSL